MTIKLSTLDKARNTVERRQKKLEEAIAEGDKTKITRAALRLKDAQAARDCAEYEHFWPQAVKLVENDAQPSPEERQRGLQRTLLAREKLKGHKSKEAIIGAVYDSIGNGAHVKTKFGDKLYDLGEVSSMSESSLRDRLKEI